ncbi:hypothetical protein HETIRDRAFT_433142 [Heterobasidion irregulare TC 32-1]|uniref:Uncharacterized protein n=1 Tax=Heterobasidion irregulare (strain TC 32-1) TaxID=747525 RepID=W4KEP9_HETIT|nr:uncharacterized protein HETIRDRAFT_433142 [Heterobasidion irregulare TC 32-1]ETW84224.1 hypothetical protein HETIRDRAFT_433142 [Heterobasidion irregulare TC 32-1]
MQHVQDQPVDAYHPFSPESPLTSSLFAATSAIDDLTRSLADFSRVSTPEPHTVLTCCCAREDCEYTKAWLVVKSKLENRLILAAEVGQALLQRHEAYIRRVQSEDQELQPPTTDVLADSREIDPSSQQELEARVGELVKENAVLEKRFHQALINNEVAESTNKLMSQELQEARVIVGRLSTEHARFVGWDTRVRNLTQEKDDLQQERDNESSRARIAEARLVAMNEKCSKLRSQVHKLQEDLERQYLHRSELSEEILQDTRVRIEQIQHAHSGRVSLTEDDEVTKILQSLVADNEALQKSNVELQTLLADSRESIQALQQEAEEQRAFMKQPSSRAEPPSLRHRYTHSNSSLLGRDQLQPPSPVSYHGTASGSASPLSFSYSIRGKHPIKRPASAEPRFHRGLEPLSPDTSRGPASPNEALPPLDINIDDREGGMARLSPEKPRAQKPLLLLTRSRGVQTAPWIGMLSPLPSNFGEHPSFSTSSHDAHSDSSSMADNPSTLSILLDRIAQLFNRIAQADALTLTIRLKRQHLLGADVSHLSRTTVEAILSDVTNLRTQYRSFLEDDKAVSSCTRKDLRALFKLFRDVFQELGTIRVTLNDIILDPSLAPRIREIAMNPTKAETAETGHDVPLSLAPGWMAPLTKLFRAPADKDKEKRSFTPLVRTGSKGATKRTPRLVPKIAPATSASTTTVNVEFSGTGVGRAITSTGTFTPGPGQDTDSHQASIRLSNSNRNVSQSVMGIFAGAPRPDSSADPWIVVPKAGTKFRPKTPSALSGKVDNDYMSTSQARTIRGLSRRVDAIIDNKSTMQEGASADPTLLERTLRRRGLSDSSIHTSFLTDGEVTGRPVSGQSDAEHQIERDPQTVLQAFSRKGNDLRIAASAVAGPPISSHLSESSSAGRSGLIPHDIPPRALPSRMASMIPDLSTWGTVGYGIHALDEEALYAGTSRQEPLRRPWHREI